VQAGQSDRGEAPQPIGLKGVALGVGQRWNGRSHQVHGAGLSQLAGRSARGVHDDLGVLGEATRTVDAGEVEDPDADDASDDQRRRRRQPEAVPLLFRRR
jgi:hypothetical protein